MDTLLLASHDIATKKPLLMKAKIRQLIAEGKTSRAIQELQQITGKLEDQDLHEEALMAAARYEAYAREKRTGTSSSEEQLLVLARINHALLGITAQLPESSKDVEEQRTSVKTAFREVQILIDGAIEDFNQTRKENLINVISAILNIESSEVKIKRLVAGSVKITIELPIDKAEELVQLFLVNSEIAAKLKKELNVLDIRFAQADSLPSNSSSKGSGSSNFLARRKWWEWVLAAGVVVAILAGLTDIFGENLKTLFGKTSTVANTVTVLAHGPGGKDDKVLPSRGIVKLIYGDAIVTKQINNEGEATFKQIGDAFFAKDARVEILFEDPEGEPYRALRNDSLYRLERGKYVALEVKLYGLERLKGIVKDFNTGKAIEGAKVRVQGEETTSNAYGEFTLDLPPDKQEKFQTIRAYHPDYQDYEMTNVPTQTQREIAIMMKP
jgi:hypothetical protein